MTLRLRPVLRLALLLSLSASAAVAWGKPPANRVHLASQDTPAQAPPARTQPVETLSDTVRRIERATRGQVLSAERLQFDGRDVHRVKVLDDRGRVRVYTDDPAARPGLRTRRDDGSPTNL